MSQKLPKSVIDALIKNLISIRKERGLSHEKLAQLSGLNRSTISLIEARKREPTLLSLLRVTEALEYNLGDLLSKAYREVKK